MSNESIEIRYTKNEEISLIIKKTEKINERKHVIKYKNTFKKLGSGGFSNVYLFELENGDKIAGKIINKKKYEEGNRVKNEQFLKDEINLQKSFDRPDIVKVIDFFEHESNFFLFLEYCKNLSLEYLIKERGKLTEKEVACYMLQLIIALNFLHSNKIIHRDLKPANLLLGQNMELKIGDFGLATKILEGKIKGIVGTISFCAPEVLKNEDYSFEADIWSLGIIMYNLLTHKYPFYAETEKEIANKIKEEPPVLSEEISTAASDLIKQILEKDPSKRPTLNQIIYHDFFNRGGIPKYLPDSIKKQPPLDYPQDILNKEEIIYKDLKRIVRNIIKPITYDSIHSIDEIRINNFNYIKIDIYIKNYLDIIKRFGVGYELSNGNIGVYYKDKTKILLDPNTNEFSFFDKKNEVFHYKMWDYPDNLENKIKILISFINYFEKFKKDNYKTIYEPKNKDDKERDNIYVNDVISIDECIKFKISNETNHIFFHDKVQIIISYAEQRVIYIDKDKNITNLSLGEASINPCRELRKRIQFIQKLNIESIVTKMKHKMEKISY